MDEHVYYNDLFDCYKSLLTPNEIKCFEEYYLEDYSYGEIAISKNISRSAVQKTIKIVVEKLKDYEKKLNLLKLRKELIMLEKEEDIIKIKKCIERILSEL